MILALLLACSPFNDVESRWNAAWEACDPDTLSAEPDPYDLDASLSEGCQDQLQADFHVDVDSLRAAPVTDTSPPLEDCFTLSAFTLLVRDGGPYDGQAGGGVYPVYVEQMSEIVARIGGDDNRKLAYNFASWFTAGVTLDESLEAGALAITQEDGLHLSPEISDECGLELAHVIFHEAGHAVLEGHVACPDDPDAACDADDQGTTALERSLIALWLGECEDQEDPECVYLDEVHGALGALILEP